jgi:hypothetical protein
VLITMAAATAHAEPLTRAQKAKLELLKRAAERASADGNFGDAAAQLDQALRILPDDPELLLSLARTYDEWGNHCSEALAALARFFAACGACALADRGKNEEVLIVNRCASDVTFDVEPPGSIVQIEGEDYARAAPFTTQMKAGAYTIKVRRHGHLPRQIELIVEPATPQKVPIALEVDPVLQARPKRDERATTLTAPPPIAESSTPVSTYAALGAGVAGGIAGVVFTMMSIDKVDDERTARYAGASEDELNDLRSSARTNAALAYVGFGVSLAGFAAAVILDAFVE